MNSAEILHSEVNHNIQANMAKNIPNQLEPAALAPGYKAIVAACNKLYPEQKNPVTLSAALKFWMGGRDPLDYILVFSSQDDCSHWHYVSCGLSDLHGDGRVHPPAMSPQGPSGYGFELTFRLKRANELMPPTWPGKVLQTISKYVFKTENKLVAGDHITEGEPLGTPSSKLRHFLVDEDVQLEPIQTPVGQLRFLQIYGVTEDELKAAQRWNGPGILRLLRKTIGGNLLVTDIHRPLSLFESAPETRVMVETGIAKEGSNLCGVASLISWTESDVTASRERELTGECALSDWASLSQQCDRLMDDGLNSRHVSYPRGVALACDLETAGYLTLSIQGRLKHGFHFTLKSIKKESAVTFVTERVAGTQVTPTTPFAAQGSWLQLLVKESILDQFQEKIAYLNSGVALPYTIRFEDPRLTITIFGDGSQI